MEGKPQFDGGACQHYWTANYLDDAKFHDFVYPLLVAAKASAETVRVSVDGCTGGVYPAIYGIDFPPRE